nr:MAG TPA: hypothetical protein [Caudoviricetes sp.]
MAYLQATILNMSLVAFCMPLLKKTTDFFNSGTAY